MTLSDPRTTPHLTVVGGADRFAPVSGRILVADDDPITRRLLVRGLAANGATVLEAADGFEALAACRDPRLELAILDVEMPRMSGLDVLAALRQSSLTAHLPVFLLTGHDLTGGAARGLGLGANDYLLKPCDLDELQARADAAVLLGRRTKQLAESEAAFRGLFHGSSTAMAVLDLHGGVQRANRAWERLYGQAFPAGCGEDSTRFVHWQDRDELRLALTEMRAGRRLTHACRIRLLPSGQPERWGDASMTVALDRSGSPAHVHQVVTDVTSAVSALDALERSEQRQAAVLEHLPGTAIFVLDRDLRVITADGAAIRTAGRHQASEMVGRPLQELLVPADYAFLQPRYADVVAGSLTGAFEFAAESGRHYLVDPVPLVQDQHGVSQILIAVRDITETKQAEGALVASLAQRAADQDQLVEAQRIAQFGGFEYDLDLGMRATSDQTCALWGLPAGQFSETARERLVAAEDRQRVAEHWATALRLGGRHEVEFRIQRPDDGSSRYLRATFEVRLDAHGGLVSVRGTYRDVTATAESRHAAEKATAFRDAVLRASPDYTFITDLDSGTVLFGSPGKKVLGISTEELEALDAPGLRALIHPEDQPRVDAVNIAVGALEDGQVLQLRYRGRHLDGSWHWLNRRITPFKRDQHGRVTEVLGVVRDVTEVVEVEQRLSHAALHDGLTGLPNRSLLVDRLDAALARSAREGREVAVLFCDLDGFKRVNDTAGHAVGDQVLIEVARRLAKILRPGDTVARIGGDEFVLVLEPWNREVGLQRAGGSGDRAVALGVAARVSESLRQPIIVGEGHHVVSASIGITHAGLPGAGRRGSGETITGPEMLQQADMAMYRAKSRGKDRYEVFELGMQTDLAERGRVEEVLREALGQRSDRDEQQATVPAPRTGTAHLMAHYQPVFCARTGDLVSFEALARLRDSDGLAIAPDVFISVAEDTNLIRALGSRMLEMACCQLADWRRTRTGMQAVTMAVNVSALQAQHASLAADVHTALTASGLQPADLVLELTETALLHAAHSTITGLGSLRDAGVGIAIDDFGVGYASLRYLATLPVTAVKIDRSFTVGLPHDQTSNKIVKAIAGLADDLDLACIVEGVETEVQRAALPPGVQIQGFLTGRPLAPRDLDTWLEQGSSEQRAPST